MTRLAFVALAAARSLVERDRCSVVRLVSILLALLSGPACHVSVDVGYRATRADGDEAVRLFRQRFHEERYDDIYAAMHASLRATTSKSAMLAQMRQRRLQFGDLVTAEAAGSFCRLGDIELWYHSHYEHGDLTEMFRWRNRNAATELVVYGASEGFVEPRPELHDECP